MRAAVALALVLGLCSVAAGAPGRRVYRGARVTLDLKAAPVVDVLRVLADVGKINIVLADPPPPPLDIKVKGVPWDKVLDDVVRRSSLAYQRAGNLLIVGSPDLIAKRNKAKKRAYKGRPIDLDVTNAEAPAAAKLLAIAGGMAVAIDGKGPQPAMLRLKKIPADQAAELLALHTGTSLMVKEVPPVRLAAEGCIAETTQLKQLRLAGIARSGTRAWALFIDPTGQAYVVTKGSCIGVGATMINGFGAGSVSLDLGDAETSAELRPRP